jgi:hypothetical protein
MTPPITPQSRPARWPWLAAAQDDGQLFLYDPRRIAGPPLPVTRRDLEAINLFTGRHTLAEIQSALALKFGPAFAPMDSLLALADRLDRGFFLNGPTFHAYLAGPVRRPSCIGCYPPDPADIHAQMRGLFTAPGGSGLPSGTRDGPRLRAVLVPHMDFARGNVTYGWGFKELAERTTARLFVIVATSHYSPARFTLTRMNFEMPLGVVETDQAYIDRIAKEYGDGLFDDPLAHLPEHSVELEVVVMQHLFADRPFRIVPLLVGSFGDCVSSLTRPDRVPEIQRMVAALRAAEAAAGEEVCYVISGDLAHIGPKFDDPDPVGEPWLTESRKQDEAILAKLAAADAGGYFDAIAAEEDARRICGLPPTFLTLAAAGPTTGRVLHYQQFVHPQGFESVSFAAAAFYEDFPA